MMSSGDKSCWKLEEELGFWGWRLHAHWWRVYDAVKFAARHKNVA